MVNIPKDSAGRCVFFCYRIVSENVASAIAKGNALKRRDFRIVDLAEATEPGRI